MGKQWALGPWGLSFLCECVKWQPEGSFSCMRGDVSVTGTYHVPSIHEHFQGFKLLAPQKYLWMREGALDIKEAFQAWWQQGLSPYP